METACGGKSLLELYPKYEAIIANRMGRIFCNEMEPDFFGFLFGYDNSRLVEVKQERAQFVSSLCQDGMHAPVIDIDFPALLLPFKDEKQVLILDVAVHPLAAGELILAVREAGISSYGRGSWMILDCPAILAPSTTSGHFHLYLETKTTWPRFEKFLIALAEAGIIEMGFCDVCIRHKQATVLPPWVNKHMLENLDNFY